MTEPGRPWMEMGWKHGEVVGDWLHIKDGQRSIRVLLVPGVIVESHRQKQDSVAMYRVPKKAD